SATRLPDSYWEITDGHYLIRLLPPGISLTKSRPEERLALRNLRRTRKEDSEAEPLWAFKLLGHPTWAQDPESHICCCGSPMQMLLQLPDGFGFDMVAGAPEQP